MREIIDFTRFRVLAPLLSLVLVVLCGLLTFSLGGFNFSIDFSPGFEIQLLRTDPQVGEEQIRTQLSGEELAGLQIQRVGTEGRFTLRFPLDSEQDDVSSQVLETVRSSLPDFTIEEVQFVGPDVARGLSRTTVVLIPLALLLILLYIWVRFKLIYALSAITALIHDTLFLLAVIGAFRLEFSAATVAALLTVIGYSLNDTIVIFDRIRENQGLMADKSTATIINASLTQTLSRTFVTSITTVIALLPVIFFSYGSIRTVATQLVIGVAIGTYSSLFIASPMVYYLQKRRKKKLRASGFSATESVRLGDDSRAKIIRPTEPPVQQTAAEIAAARGKKLKKKMQRRKKR